jgi:hypothetical protein
MSAFQRVAAQRRYSILRAGFGEPAMKLRDGLVAVSLGLSSASALASCSSQEAPVRDPVLVPGQVVDAKNASGEVRVSYVSARQRRYQWDGETRVVTMKARPEPFLGKRGLYNPAPGFSTPPGATRLVVDESKLRFANYSEAREYLWPEARTMDWAYLPDGLVLGFARFPGRNQINIDLFQIYIGDKLADPSKLRDENINSDPAIGESRN